MFGLGPSELVMIFLLVLLLFGPSKLPQMARDLGRFAGEARRSIDEFKEELTSSVDDEGENKNSYRKNGGNSPVRRKETSKSGTQRETRKEDARAEGAEEEGEYDF